MKKDLRTRIYVLDRLPLYAEQEFSTMAVQHYLAVHHSRHQLTTEETVALLETLPEVEKINRHRWRYDPQRIPQEEQGIIKAVLAWGTVPIWVLQDKFGQDAVAMAGEHGSIQDAGGDAMLTGLGIKRAQELEGIA